MLLVERNRHRRSDHGVVESHPDQLHADWYLEGNPAPSVISGRDIAERDLRLGHADVDNLVVAPVPSPQDEIQLVRTEGVGAHIAERDVDADKAVPRLGL